MNDLLHIIGEYIDCYPQMRSNFLALDKVKNSLLLYVEFPGTSYRAVIQGETLKRLAQMAEGDVELWLHDFIQEMRNG